MRLATVMWGIVATGLVLLGMLFLWVALRGPSDVPLSDFLAVEVDASQTHVAVDAAEDVQSADSDAFGDGESDAGNDG